MTFTCKKGGLRDVYLFHPDLVVIVMKVSFGEKIGSMKFIQEVINNWDRKCVLDGQLIKSLELKTHVPSTFLFNTMTTSDEHGLVLGSMTPSSNSSWIIFSISFLCVKGCR